MKAKIDMSALLNLQINKELLKTEEIAPFVKACNKYGVYGTKAVELPIDIIDAAQNMNTAEGEVDE
jgi:hypothetical protein